MDPIERQQFSLRAPCGDADGNGRSPMLASVEIDVDLLRKNERTLADDELSDAEAEAFGFC